MQTGRFLTALLPVGLLFAGLLAPGTAAADAVKLRSGRVLQAEAVEVLEDRVRLTVRLQDGPDGERAQVEFGFDKFEPRTVLELYDRHTDRADAKAVLRGGHVAIRLGLPEHAERRFRKARVLDPSLADAAKEGLDRIPFARATQALAKLEKRLRGGQDPSAVHEALEALLVGPHSMHLTAAQVKRIEVLSKLAKRLAQRAAARKAAAEKAKKPKPVPKKPPVPDRPPPPRTTETSPHPPGSYADRRWRERRGHLPRRPAGELPGRQRPPLQGERGGASRGRPGGARSGGQGAQGGGSGGARGGGQGGAPPSGASGGGQGVGPGR